MQLARALTAVALGSFFLSGAQAETRFMKLDHSSVAGRKVITKEGGEYVFHSNGKYSSVLPTGRKRKGRWTVEYANVIRVTYKSGQYTDIGTFIDDGSQKLWFIGRGRKRSGTIANIVPE